MNEDTRESTKEFGPFDAATLPNNERPDVAESVPGRLGRLPTKSDTRALLFNRYADLPKTLPKATNFWRRRAPFTPRSFGNLLYGSCTRSKQAIAARRFERLEVRRTPTISDDEIVRVYVEMSNRLYGGGDNGAYETDALNEWRNPETTFRDTQGRALTIDAYVRLNPYDHEEIKTALWASEGHGLAFCINLPWAFSRIRPPHDWAVPAGQLMVGEWMPGSWGGHSMWLYDYDEIGLLFDHTWELEPQRITWDAASKYIDEVHLVIDSLDYWRKQKARAKKWLDLAKITTDVNKVSSLKIAA